MDGWTIDEMESIQLCLLYPLTLHIFITIASSVFNILKVINFLDFFEFFRFRLTSKLI